MLDVVCGLANGHVFQQCQRLPAISVITITSNTSSSHQWLLHYYPCTVYT